MTKPIEKDEVGHLRDKINELESCKKKHEELVDSLKESESRYRMIFENANDGIILHDLDGNIIDINTTMYKRLGYTKDQVMRMMLDRLVVAEYVPSIKERVRKLEENGVALFESGDLRKDGTVIPVEVNARLVDYKGKKIIQSVVRDISDRRMAEDLIETTLAERELLVKEMHWRSQLCSWFFGQVRDYISRAISEEEKNEAVDSAYERIKTMVFIEDKIFRSLSFKKIEMFPLAKTIIAHLATLYGAGLKKVHIENAIRDVYLDVHAAVVYAFLLSELLSNCLRHAFPGARSGIISVFSEQDRSGRCILKVVDDGIGFPGNLDPYSEDSFGMEIIGELVKQLNGRWEIVRNKGTEFKMAFSKQAAK